MLIVNLKSLIVSVYIMMFYFKFIEQTCSLCKLCLNLVYIFVVLFHTFKHILSRKCIHFTEKSLYVSILGLGKLTRFFRVNALID